MRRLAVALGLAAWAAPLPAQGPALAVTRDGRVARVQATGLLGDGRFTDLMRSGFPLRLHFRLELWRERAGWFDRYVTGVDWNAVARHDPLAEEFMLLRTGGGMTRYNSTEDLAAALALPYRVALAADGDGRFYFVARLEVATLNDTDLEELTRWLKGDVTPAVSGRESVGEALARGAQRALVRIAGLPTLTLGSRSEAFPGEVGDR
ncbi:MAG: DUF4390 domain-containing protein [Gemmatimonadales bacterium]